MGKINKTKILLPESVINKSLVIQLDNLETYQGPDREMFWKEQARIEGVVISDIYDEVCESLNDNGVSPEMFFGRHAWNVQALPATQVDSLGRLTFGHMLNASYTTIEGATYRIAYIIINNVKYISLWVNGEMVASVKRK